jgi:hypothetical protein
MGEVINAKKTWFGISEGMKYLGKLRTNGKTIKPILQKLIF